MDRQAKATLAALTTLKRQFEAGASQYHRLNHLLVEAQADQREWLSGPFPVEGCRQPKQAIATSLPPPEISFRVRSNEGQDSRVAQLLGPRSILQFHMLYVSGSYVTDDDVREYIIGRDQFSRLAGRAGECLLSLPAHVINVYPAEWAEYEQYLKPHLFTTVDPSSPAEHPRIQTVERTYDAVLPIGSGWSDRWCGFLHWLAWRNEEGTILNARRRTWVGTTTLPWVPTRSDHGKITSMMPPLAAFSFETTRHFNSVLEDVFLCSALAIDVIEAKLAQDRPKRSPTAPGATNVVQDSGKPLKAMFCYSHNNRRQRDQVEKHLALMKRDNLVEIWYDRNITAGAEWKGRIDEHLNQCEIILLMVSADFIASDYCFDVEMKRAIQRHEAGEARVIPVILRKCEWKNTPLKDIQALPSDGRPVDQWPRSNDAYHDIADGIRKVAEELKAQPH